MATNHKLGILSYIVERSKSYSIIPTSLEVTDLSVDPDQWFDFVRSEYHPIGACESHIDSLNIAKKDHHILPKNAKVEMEISNLDDDKLEPFKITCEKSDKQGIFWFQKIRIYLPGRVRIKFTCSDSQVAPFVQDIIAMDSRKNKSKSKRTSLEEGVVKGVESDKVKLYADHGEPMDIENSKVHKDEKAESSVPSSRSKRSSKDHTQNESRLSTPAAPTFKPVTEKEIVVVPAISHTPSSSSRKGKNVEEIADETNDNRRSGRKRGRANFEEKEEEAVLVKVLEKEEVISKPQLNKSSILNKLDRAFESVEISHHAVEISQNFLNSVNLPPNLSALPVKFRLDRYPPALAPSSTTSAVNLITLKGNVMELGISNYLLALSYHDRSNVSHFISTALQSFLNENGEKSSIFHQLWYKKLITPSVHDLFNRLEQRCIHVNNSVNLIISLRCLFEDIFVHKLLYPHELESYHKTIIAAASKSKRLIASAVGVFHFLRFIMYVVLQADHPEGK
jgi:hypothetical protein